MKGLAFSLLLSLVSPCPIRAADQLEVTFDGVVIPVDIKDLVAWGRSGGVSNTELGIWLDLLEPASRRGMLELLRAPLITNRSMARQMLDSWAGRRLLDEVADLVRVDDDTIGVTVLNTLEVLLSKQPHVTSLDLLEALPAERVRLDLDGLLGVAEHWRGQLKHQQALVNRLDQIPITAVAPSQSISIDATTGRAPLSKALTVAHRPRPLQLQLWQPPAERFRSNARDRPWIVLMPGLGGSPDHFRWLGRLLSAKGWPVVVLEHPGSDSEAVGAWLQGRRRPLGRRCCLTASKIWRRSFRPRRRVPCLLSGTRWCWWAILWAPSPRYWQRVCVHSLVWSVAVARRLMISLSAICPVCCSAS